MAKEWFTVKECLGLPGFPGSEPAVRERLYKYSEGKEGGSGVSVLNQRPRSFIYLFSLFMFIVILTTAERNRRQNPFPYRKRSLKISRR